MSLLPIPLPPCIVDALQMAPAQTRDNHLSIHFPNIYRVLIRYQAQPGTLLPCWDPQHILEGTAVGAAVLTRASSGMSCPRGPKMLSHFPSLSNLNAFQPFTPFSDEDLNIGRCTSNVATLSIDSITSIGTCFLNSWSHSAYTWDDFSQPTGRKIVFLFPKRKYKTSEIQGFKMAVTCDLCKVIQQIDKRTETRA